MKKKKTAPCCPGPKLQMQSGRFSWPFLIYVLFLVLLVISWLCEFICGKSFCELHIPCLSCPDVFKASVILEVIKIVGFSTFLIGWIYNSLDRQILGLSYRDLLCIRFPFYHFYSIFHVCVTIVCILSAKANQTESALLSFIAVLFGFGYQWSVLNVLFFNAQLCRNAAVEVWNVRIDQAALTSDADKRGEKQWDPSGKNLPAYIHHLSNQCPPIGTEHFSAHLDCLFSAVRRYAGQTLSLDVISNLWANLFRNNYNHDDIFVAMAVIDELLHQYQANHEAAPQASPNQQSVPQAQFTEGICILLSGYLVNRIKLPRSNRNSKEVSMDVVFQNLAADVALLSNHYCAEPDPVCQKISSDFLDSLQSCFCALFWVHYLRRTISLLPELPTLIPQRFCRTYITDVVITALTPAGEAQEKALREQIRRIIPLCQKKF